MSASEAWTCPSCRTEVTTPFCPGCGERPLRPRDLTFRGLVEMVVLAISRIDVRLIRSVRLLVTQPGALTAAFRQGQRKPFIGPIALFLVANVLFFAVQSLTRMKIFSTSLGMHLNGMFWGDLADAMVGQRLQATGRTLEVYAPVFDQAVAANAKSMIGLMVPLMAAATAALFRRAMQPFAVHVAFSLHYHAFLLLLICVPLVAAIAEGMVGAPAVLPPLADDLVSVGLLAAVCLYLYAAIGRVFEARGLRRAVMAVALTVVAMASFLAYRFVLLPITLYTT